MIEICNNNARALVEMVKSFFLSPVGIFLYAVSTGAIGIVILLMFFSMMLSAAALLPLLFVILAFNGATSGYGLADKGELFRFQKTGLVGIAVILTIVGCSIITLFCPWEPLVDTNRYLIAGTCTLTATLIGSWIAYKNKSLQDK